MVVNHLKSKGSDCDDVNDPDTGDGQGNCNVTRTKAAGALVRWLATDPTGAGGSRRAPHRRHEFRTRWSIPIAALHEWGLRPTSCTALVGAGGYSYVFEGQSGYLDHALASRFARAAGDRHQ